MKIFLDDIRPTPDGWIRCFSVNQLIKLLTETKIDEVEEISLDHDLGDYHNDGGDGVKALLWMIENDKIPATIKIHSSNPVGRENMNSLIRRYVHNEIL